MSSWIYVFSNFTPEALLFEALLIGILLAGYAAFWVLHKRRHGIREASIPIPVVKEYLNALIGEAQTLRSELFGLLASGKEIDADSLLRRMSAGGPMVSSGGGGSSAQELNALERKMLEQASALSTVEAEKAKLEKELAAARAASVTGQGPDPAMLKELQAKIATLESKLAEYSVIEDDLANLKRLQQENAQLRSALEGKGPVPPATPLNTPVAARPAPEPVVVPEPIVVAAAPPAKEEALFENLAEKVNESLQPEVVAAAPAAPEPAPTPVAAPATPASTSAAPEANMKKEDADLVAEFERMLNG